MTVEVPLFAMPPDKKLRQVTFAVEELSVEDAAKDSEMNSASVSQPSVSHTADLYQHIVPDAASAAAQEDSEMKNTDDDSGLTLLQVLANAYQSSARVAASAAAQEDSGRSSDWHCLRWHCVDWP